ncbi:MAG: zinc ribbon domain-containing protein [Mobilitalea sp.]
MNIINMKTITLKLYQPSKVKQEILDEAILHYNQAYYHLLNRAQLDLESIKKNFSNKNGAFRGAAISKWVDKDLNKELNQYQVQPFKDSLKLDFGMTLAGYFNISLFNSNVAFPASNHTESNRKPRPVYFCRYDSKRNYCLLYDQVKDKYYVKLYLMNYSHARLAAERTDSKLHYIHRDNKLLERERDKETFLILPLSFGKYQEQFLKQAKAEPDIIKTAKLFKKDKEYYLAISIDTTAKEFLPTDTFLGVSRGLKNKLNYTVVDKEGHCLAAGAVVEQDGPSELHIAANHIVNIAKKYKAQVILQNLSHGSDYIVWREERKVSAPVYQYRLYQKLKTILDYKLKEQGLPAPIKVSSIDLFHRCTECGMSSRQNRFSKERFLCTKCGFTMEIDALGSLNLSRKLIHYKKSKIKIKVFETAEGILFTNKLMGLHYFASHSESVLEGLSQELQRIADDINDNSMQSIQVLRLKRSIRYKLKDDRGLLDCIQFI